METNERPALLTQAIMVTETFSLPFIDEREAGLGDYLKRQSARLLSDPRFGSPLLTYTTPIAEFLRVHGDGILVRRLLDTHSDAITRLYDQIPARSESRDELRTAA